MGLARIQLTFIGEEIGSEKGRGEIQVWVSFSDATKASCPRDVDISTQQPRWVLMGAQEARASLLQTKGPGSGPQSFHIPSLLLSAPLESPATTRLATVLCWGGRGIKSRDPGSWSNLYLLFRIAV